jgi:hypothetical protein
MQGAKRKVPPQPRDWQKTVKSVAKSFSVVRGFSVANSFSVVKRSGFLQLLDIFSLPRRQPCQACPGAVGVVVHLVMSQLTVDVTVGKSARIWIIFPNILNEMLGEP